MSQYVVFDGVKSVTSICAIAVQKSSVVEPLLFLLFVNHFPKFSEHGKITMFSDDNSCVCSGTTIN